MKKPHLKRLEKLIERFDSLKAILEESIEPHINDIGDAKSDLATLTAEVQNNFDGMSERWQESDRGQKLEAEIASLLEADTALEDALEKVREIDEQLETAIGELREATGEQ